MADFPNIEPDLEEIALIANNQTYDSILTGEFQSAGLSGAKWQCTPTFSNRNGKEARDLRAFIFNQEGVTGRFNYYPASIDNLGTHAGLGVVDGAGQVGKSLLTKGWDADQELLFAAGDYLTVNGEMKMITADVSVVQDYIEYDAVNYMSSPFDPEGWRGASDPEGSITNVTIENPSGIGFIGLAEQTSDGPFGLNDNFSNQIPFNMGDNLYVSILFKTLGTPAGLSVNLSDVGGAGLLTFSTFDLNNRTKNGGAEDDFRFTDLGNGYYSLEVLKIAPDDIPNTYASIQLYGQDGSGTAPIGTKLYVQAAFFGKADDWPAKIRANATIPITPALRVSPSDENAIEVNNPYFPARLETDDQSRLQVSSPVIYNTSLSIVEDF